MNARQTILTHVRAAWEGSWWQESRGVPYRPSRWLGRQLTDAERQALSRALAELEREGVIQRVADFGRTTGIVLTKGK